MSYAPGVSAVQTASKVKNPRVKNRFPNGNGIASAGTGARRQSARTSTNGTNPPKTVGTLKGGGLR